MGVGETISAIKSQATLPFTNSSFSSSSFSHSLLHHNWLKAPSSLLCTESKWMVPGRHLLRTPEVLVSLTVSMVAVENPSPSLVAESNESIHLSNHTWEIPKDHLHVWHITEKYISEYYLNYSPLYRCPKKAPSKHSPCCPHTGLLTEQTGDDHACAAQSWVPLVRT